MKEVIDEFQSYFMNMIRIDGKPLERNQPITEIINQRTPLITPKYESSSIITEPNDYRLVLATLVLIIYILGITFYFKYSKKKEHIIETPEDNENDIIDDVFD